MANNFPSAEYNAATRTVALQRTAFTFRFATVRSPDSNAEAVEVARMLDLTVRTVQRDWAKARMLLSRMLESE